MQRLYTLLLMLALYVLASSSIYAQSTRLKDIKSDEGYSYFTLSYDEKGRVTQIESECFVEKYEISYSPIVIKEYIEDWEAGGGWKLYYTYSAKTDSKGRIIQMDVEGRDGVMGFSDTYTYDNDGYLVSTVRKSPDGEQAQTTQYTWENGNLTETLWTDKYLSGWNDTKGDYHELYVTDHLSMTATYGNQTTVSRPIALGTWVAQGGQTLVCVSGLFGNTSKNLPTHVFLSGLPTEYPDAYPNEYRDNSRGWEEEYSFSYTFNTDGTVATEKYVWQGEDENTGLPITETETLIYTYEQGVDGIGEVVKNLVLDAQALYDLSGRKIGESSNHPIKKGIYVKDGRKVVIK